MTAAVKRLPVMIVAAVFAAAGCRTRATPPREAGAPHAGPRSTASSDDGPRRRASGCGAQAARFAANNLWRSSTRDRLVRQAAHYSDKYDECYVLLDRTFSVPGGPAPAVSELWEAFDGVVLAVFTAAEDATTRKSFCQVALSDNPYTSCAVAKFFIDEHMTH